MKNVFDILGFDPHIETLKVNAVNHEVLQVRDVIFAAEDIELEIFSKLIGMDKSFNVEAGMCSHEPAKKTG